jgi:hypothetical protein
VLVVVAGEPTCEQGHEKRICERNRYGVDVLEARRDDLLRLELAYLALQIVASKRGFVAAE